MFVESADYSERVLRKFGDSVSRFGKGIQYVLFILMICLVLALPAAATEALDGTSANQMGDIVNDTIHPITTSSAIFPEDVTAEPTEYLPEPSAQALGMQTSEPVVLFDGTVALTEGTFECEASGTTYTVPNNTPLGALQAVAERRGFTYAVTDKKWEASEVLLLDDIGEYVYVKKGPEWACYVNGDKKDGYSGRDYGLNVIELAEDDVVIYCYGEDPTPDDADVLIRIVMGLED